MSKNEIKVLGSLRLDKRAIRGVATFLLGALFSSGVHAAPEDFIGNFSGTENVTISECSNPVYNATKTSFWSLKAGDLQDTSYKGKGRNDDGEFAFEGNVTGNEAAGKLKGTNRWGHAWTGEYTAKMEDEKR
ncbi:MAG: hypothetical protein ACREV9_03285 [Burkholderiales bacterium]